MKRLTAITVAIMLALSVGAVAEYRTLTLPKALKSIETEAFYNDQDVRNVVVPEGVTRIGARAFVGSGLRMIQLPASVTAIDGDPFDGADSVVVVAKKGTYACQWAETHGYTVSQDAQRWVVDKAAWSETKYKEICVCGDCGRQFSSFSDYEAHIKSQLTGGEITGCTGRWGSITVKDGTIEHPEEGHYETVS